MEDKLLKKAVLIKALTGIVLLAVFIIIICVVILVAGGFGNSSDRGYVNSDAPVIYVLSI